MGSQLVTHLSIQLGWFPLALLCAFFLASADAATKAWLRGEDAGSLVLVRLALTGLLLAPLALAPPLPTLPAAFWFWIASLIPLEIVAMWLYMRAIQSAPLALTLPYLAFTPVFVVLTGWIVLGERVELPGVTGIALVVAGAWLLNLGEDDRSSPLAPFRAIWNIRGSRLMLLAAIIYSITSVGGKAAMQWLPAERFGPLYFSMVGFGAALVFGLSQPRRFRIIIDKPLPSLGIAALMALMVLTHFEALSRVEVAYMIAVKRSSLLFGILYGVLLFHERSGLRHFLAGALMVAGITLLAG